MMAKATEVKYNESVCKAARTPSRNKTVPLAIPNQRLPRTILRTRNETLSEIRSPRGGIAGKMYPGNFDFDTLKKANVKVIQQAKYSPGDVRQDLAPGGRRKSLATVANISVHGISPKSTIGT